jgi:hypothetical protein
MKFSDLEKSALQLNDLYEQLEIKKYGRIWTTEELALGFVGDVGDLAKTDPGKCRYPEYRRLQGQAWSRTVRLLVVGSCSCKQVRH